MKNFYALIHFDGIYVSGFLTIGHKDSESARFAVIKSLTDALQIEREEQSKASDNNKSHYDVNIKRLISFRRCFTKPHRKNKRGAPVLEMMELPNNFVMQAGHWLSLGSGDNSKGHLCNLPRQRTEHPKGYVISTLD